MTSKKLSNLNILNKIKNGFKLSSIKVLILLSVIIILILIYLKLKNTELYTSTIDIFFNNYFEKQALSKKLQNTLDAEAKIINDLGNDVQIVLSGGIMAGSGGAGSGGAGSGGLGGSGSGGAGTGGSGGLGGLGGLGGSGESGLQGSSSEQILQQTPTEPPIDPIWRYEDTGEIVDVYKIIDDKSIYTTAIILGFYMVIPYTSTNYISIASNVYYYYQGSDSKYTISNTILRATNDRRPLYANRLQIIDNNKFRAIILATTKLPPSESSRPLIINAPTPSCTDSNCGNQKQQCYLHIPPLANGNTWTCINTY